MTGLIIRTTGVEEFLDASGEANVKALILGLPSAGKTRSASFWPKPIYADCEKGRMSIADRHVPYGEILSSADMEAFLRAIEVECKKPVAQRRYHTVVLDTIDAYQRLLMQERLRSERKEAFSGYADWGWLDAKTTALLVRLLALPMNLVVNVHLKTSQEGDDGPIIFEPKLKGDIRDQIAAEFDLVGWMNTHWEIQGNEKVLTRTIQWHPEPRFPILKDRSGQLPRETEVSFTDEDFNGLWKTMFDRLEGLEPGEQVDVFEREEPVEVVPPTKGGPVEPKPPAKKAAAKKTVAPKQEPAARTVKAPAAAQKATTVETVVEGEESTPKTPAGTPAETPAETPAAEPEQAAEPAPGVETAERVLGGEVIAEGPQAAPEPVAVAQPEPVAPARPVVTCGTPSRNIPEGRDPAHGCGKSLAGENKDLVNIAILKTKTYLCEACLVAWRAENEKKKG